MGTVGGSKGNNGGGMTVKLDEVTAIKVHWALEACLYWDSAPAGGPWLLDPREYRHSQA